METKATRGRPSKFTPEMLPTVRDAARLGATECQLAAMLGIAVSTLSEWKASNAEFSDALKEGKAIADAEVAGSLFRRAVGFTGPDGVYQAPNVTAQIFWLKNRQPSEWRDVHRAEITGPDGGPIAAPCTRTQAEKEEFAAMIAKARSET
jgi:hypothetical protein